MTIATTNEQRFEKYISQAEAARIVGVSKQAITNLVRRGYFNTTKIAGRILVLRSEAQSLGPRHRGRPPKELSREKDPSAQSIAKRTGDGFAEYISQSEAAYIRGVSRQAIAGLIRRGRLTTTQIGGRAFLLRPEVEAFIPQARTGRPPNKKTTKVSHKKAKH